MSSSLSSHVSLAFVSIAVLGAAASHASPPATPAELAKLTQEEVSRILRMSPLPPLPADLSNRYADDDRAARLGHLLFFETRISPKGVACATCHDPHRYFTDGQALAKGLGTSRRNAPTVVDSARRRWVGWDGKFDSLWSQALSPIEHPDEMGSDRRTLLRVLRDTPELRAGFESAFGRFPAALEAVTGAVDPLANDAAKDAARDDLIDRTTVLVLKSLGAYQRRIVSPPTPLDRFVAGLKGQPDGDLDALEPSAQRGLAIFVSRGGCWQCHRGSSLTDEEFHALGLRGANGQVADDPARQVAIPFLKSNPLNVAGAFSDAQDSPKASMVRGLKEGGEFFGQFRTPALRGVGLTAPYMHDGRFATLSDVVRFYDTLEGASSVGHHGEMVLEPLGLSESERRDLVAFLTSLSPDSAILRESPWWLDPRDSADRTGSRSENAGRESEPVFSEVPK